ncbi:unnamed protein product [Caenorhabditis auriculariae]|uniref:Uncharacterized protein n=1 Tax=Caenorhabditis auriculariae TaxID=2777116 RepID=A0A8S1H285_9PELO|nr:unnamed protein product [Caenorhabditis auriculariae]
MSSRRYLISTVAGSYLPIHMTLHHGYPPPESVVSSDDKISEEADGNSGSDDGALQGELRAIANAICDLKAQQQTFPKVETALSSIETRISRLEKNMETALNSIYTLVQLQTGMNSGLNRFKEEANQQLSLIKSYLELDRQSP